MPILPDSAQCRGAPNRLFRERCRPTDDARPAHGAGRIQRAEVSLSGRREHFTWHSRPVPNAMLALYCMPGMRCCFAACIPICAWRACLHSSAAACLLLPIFADHAGGAARCHAVRVGVRVVRAGLPLRPCRPSGHSREQEVAGEGTVQEEAVAWAEQFPRGGDLSGACYVLCMCRPAMHPGRVSMLHSSLAPAWLLPSPRFLVVGAHFIFDPRTH